ncbi:MAG: hypothetical protein QXO35_02620 [Candidatus Micrarchaeia archaeon]
MNKSEMKKEIEIKPSSFSNMMVFLIIFSLIFILVSGCIELKPREGISTTVPVTVTKGSDVCAGYNESTCGAFLKEKRTATSDYICKGPIGPSYSKVDEVTYSLSAEKGWSCEETNTYLVLAGNSYIMSGSGHVGTPHGGSITLEDSRNVVSPISYGMSNLTLKCYVGVFVSVSKGKYQGGSFTLMFDGSSDILSPGDHFDGQYSFFVLPLTLTPENNRLVGNLSFLGTWTVTGKEYGSWPNKKHKSNMDVSYFISCTPFASYNVNWRCKNVYTSESYDFVNCSYDSFSTFQGGRTFLDNNTPFSKLSNYLQSYYGTYSYNPVTKETQPAGKIQVPFFMLGQGPSFQDYEEAKKLCVPWKETIVNISLGNTTFDPPFMTIPSGLELCIDNKDNKRHDITIINLQDQSIVRQYILQPKQSSCYLPYEGFYHIKDSNGDYAYLSVLSAKDTTQIYIGNNIVPNYTVVNVDGFVNFSLIERKEHNLSMTSVNRFDNYSYENNFTLNLSNPVETIRAPQTGEYKINDITTGKTGYLFVQSPLQRFLFKRDGTIDPGYEIYRPLGDLICFRSETEGLSISISRYTETENGYEWIWLTNETLSTNSYCCIKGALPGKYQGITTDGRVANWTIGNGKPSATVSIQPIGFEPEEVESTPGTKICWVNPSAISRNIITKSSSGKTFFSGKIPPLSDNVCWPTMNKTDSYVTTFVPNLDVKNIVNIKEVDSRNIQILSGGAGFDTISLIVKPGSQICWINNDNKNHTLKDENGNYIILAPSQTNCIDKSTMQEGNIYTRQLDGKEIYSDVGVIDGKGAILAPRGPIPFSLFVNPPNVNMTQSGELYITSPSYFKIINRQSVPSELYEISYITLLANSTGLADIVKTENEITIINSPVKSYTKLLLYVENTDDKNHTIRVESNGDEINILSNSFYLFEISQSTVLTDLTIKENLTRSGITNQTIINALSQIPINILGPPQIKLNKSGSNGDLLILPAPIEPYTSILYENNTNKTIVITFADTNESILENPLNNQTLDLPTQVIHGDLSSQILYDMRKYADEGAMSLLIPSFHNVTVKIHSSVFSPSEAFIPAGSTITFTNKDVIDHTIDLIKNESNIISSRSFTLLPLQSNSTSDTPKNTSFQFYDQLSNMKGNITTVAYDANIGIISTPIYPESGMVAVGGPVKFNNYDPDSDYRVEIKLTDELNVDHTYSLNLPKYANGIPGIVTWIPDKAGNATYTVRNNTIIVGTGEIVVRNSIINISIRNGEFETKSIAVDHDSKVCFIPDSPRNISITNLDTGEKIAERTIYPLGIQAIDSGSVCKRIYNCSVKQQTGDYRCTGIVNESDPSTYCSYYLINPSIACRLDNNISCVVKDQYSNDLECTTDYSKDTQPGVPGIQPQCLFQARLDGGACSGGSVVKDSSLASIINCSVSSTGLLQFNYFSGKEKTDVSNLLCNVQKSGNNIICSPTGLYSDIGCINNSINDPYCYYTPSLLTSAEKSNPYTLTDNRFCSVTTAQRTERYYTTYACDIGYDGRCTCPTNKMCGALPCDGSNVLASMSYQKSSSCTIFNRNAYNCSGDRLVETCLKTGQYNFVFPGLDNPNFTVYMKPGVSFKACKCYAANQRTVTYAKSCSIKTGGSSITPFPSNCILESEKCMFSSPSVFLCSSEENCPCKFGCGKKINYSTLGNINCVSTPGGCKVISNYNVDNGDYCKYMYTQTCTPKQGYEDKVSCKLNGSSCLISEGKKIKDDGSYCSLNLISCEPTYPDVDCSFDELTQTCKVGSIEQFCFTPASTYVVEDIDTGNMMIVEGYDRYKPLEIDIQKSEFTPSFVTTSPLSEVCFQSLDGKIHRVSVPDRVKSDGYIDVYPDRQTCLNFPYNSEPWTVRLQDKPDVAAGIKSIKQDIEVVVKSQMFDPSDLILRPNTSITFINTDSESHQLNKAIPSANFVKLILQNNILTSDSFFYNILKAEWMDIIECKNDSDCPEGSFCDVEKRCHPIKFCIRDDECPSPSICHNYKCILTKQCQTDLECGVNSKCIDDGTGIKKCITLDIQCSDSFDCYSSDPNSICINNKCTRITNCTNSLDCPSGFVCSSQTCTMIESCTDNSDCPINSVCYQGKCAMPVINNCSLDSDCPIGMYCTIVDETEDGEKIRACISSSCISNSDCSEDSNTACVTNFITNENNCTLYSPSYTEPLCTIDADCLEGGCIEGRCVISKNCSQDSDCGLINGIQSVCESSVCKIPVKCSTSTDCRSGEICQDGFCRILHDRICTTDSECNLDEICQEMKCIKKQNCSSTTNCNSLQSGAACTNASSSSPAFCQSSTNCTSDAHCASNQYCDLGIKQCISYPKTTCDSPLYGSDVSQVNVSFKLPLSTYKAYLIYSFNDNGNIFLNGQTILPTTKFRCQYSSGSGVTYIDNYSQTQQWRIPLGLLKLGNEENNMSITTCSCSGQKGFNISILYYYVSPEGIREESIIIDPNSKIQIFSPQQTEELVYIDNKTKNVLPISVKSIINSTGDIDCSTDLSSMALAIGSYERLDYATQACDSGKQIECASYNPYGPATVTFFASESGLNLSNESERLCAFQQLASVKNICPNCTTVLNVGDANITQLKDILNSANSTLILGKNAIEFVDVIGYDEFLNNYPSCSFEDIMNSIVNKSKLGLYNYTKPSIIMRFGLKDGTSNTNSACNWTDESIVTAYQDFYGIWIPILAGSGVLGTAQYCLTDPCPSFDFYGLLTSGKTNKPWTDAWFREGCGRYYYAAEGLSFTTFSMKETNYSMCDPSKMLTLLQTAQCAVGKYTLKSGTS